MIRTTQTTKAIKINNAQPRKVEEMLRDIAMVLHLTKKVKDSMIADQVMPTGGRFAQAQTEETQTSAEELALV